MSKRNKRSNRRRQRRSPQHRFIQPQIEALENRVLLASCTLPAAVEVGSGGAKELKGTSGHDCFKVTGDDWGGVKIKGSAATETDILDFSAINDNLTFLIQSKNTVKVEITTVSGSPTKSLIATDLNHLIGGGGETRFIVEKGAKIKNGRIEASEGAGTIVSFSSDIVNPDKFLWRGRHQASHRQSADQFCRCGFVDFPHIGKCG